MVVFVCMSPCRQVCICNSLCVCVGGSHNMYVEIRGQLLESWLSLSTWGLNLGLLDWWQVHVPAGPSCWPKFAFLSAVYLGPQGNKFMEELSSESARNTAISPHSHQNPPFFLKETCSTICQANFPPVMTPSQTLLKLICEMLVLGQPDCSERCLGCQLCIHLAM